MSLCINCRIDQHASCRKEWIDDDNSTSSIRVQCSCYLASHDKSQASVHESEPDNDEEDISDSDSADSDRSERIRKPHSAVRPRNKASRTLKDPQSAGRKMATYLYPLDYEKPCEWRNQANCGGGKYPIVGCLSGLQQARHHGPDKDVTNNEDGNVSRVCHSCHRYWHEANDPEYDWNEPDTTPWAPRPMEPHELELAKEREAKRKTKEKPLHD